MAYSVVNVALTTSGGGRSQYLDWINQSLHLDYKKVEEMCTGAGYCQFFDIIFPGVINLKKVKFNSRQEYEYIQNFKILQAAFTSLKVDKTIPIEKLVKGKFQDNFEFLQWFREFYSQNYDPDRMSEDYDASKARSSSANKKSIIPPAGTTKSAKRLQSPGAKSTAVTHPPPPKKVPIRSPQEPIVTKSSSTSSRPDSVNSDLEKRLEDSQNQLAECQQKIREYEEYTENFTYDLEQATKEREFYFSKLRKIEVITQENFQEGDQVLEAIQSILYETEEGFTLPTDEEAGQQVEKEFNTQAVGNLNLDEPQDTY